MYDWECLHVHRRGGQDVGFWLDLARRGAGPVLELACGTGRVTLPLAAAGIPIVGLDRDPLMLSALTRRRRQARAGGRPGPPALAADMRSFALAAQFSSIFVAYNSIQLLNLPSDLVACLSCSVRHLAPGGVFAAEVTDFQVGAADGAVGDEIVADAGGIRLTAGLRHDLAQRTSWYRRRFTGAGWAVRDDLILRSLDRRELTALLRAGGLEPVRWWCSGPTLRVVASAGSAGAP